jgi:hypothetical protein
MLEYRITKYDPAIRNRGEQYTEWTAFSHIGASFDGTVLTQAVYEKVETAYIAVATAFLREVDAGSVSIRGLETQKAKGSPYVEGAALTPMDAGEIMAKVLRDELWCRFEADRAFVHFGWDYYMYVGVASTCPDAERLAAKLGLFVEGMRSPYHPDNE